MTGKVPTSSIVCMVISCLVGFAIPIVLFFYFRKKGADKLPFYVGCGVMFLFALVLEGLVHQLVFSTPLGDAIYSNNLLYAFYGGLMAGLFEETGRYIAFQTILKKFRENDNNALMYGAGHGGFEALIILSVSMLNNIVMARYINNGEITTLTESLTGDNLAQMEETINTMLTTPSYVFLVGSIERILAVALQIALSVLVWYAVKNREQKYLYPVAIIIHLVIDMFAVILSSNDVPILLIELFVAIATALTIFFAKKVWDKNHLMNTQE